MILPVHVATRPPILAEGEAMEDGSRNRYPSLVAQDSSLGVAQKQCDS